MLAPPDGRPATAPGAQATPAGDAEGADAHANPHGDEEHPLVHEMRAAKERTRGNVRALKRRLARMDREEAELRREVRERRQRLGAHVDIISGFRMGSYNVSNRTTRMLKQRKDQLQQQVSQLGTTLSDAQTRNQRTKGEIDELRREQAVYRTVFRRMQAELAAQRDATERMRKQIAVFYKARDSAQYRMRDLQYERLRAHRRFVGEWTSLQRHWDALQRPEAARERERPAEADGDAAAGGGGDDDGPGGGLRRDSFGKDQAKAVLPETLARIRELQAHGRELLAQTGEESLDDLAYTLMVRDDEVFNMHQTLTGLANETDALSADMRAMQLRIDQLRGDGSALTERRRERLQAVEAEVREVAEQLSRVQARTGGQITAVQEAAPVLLDLCEGLETEMIAAVADADAAVAQLRAEIEGPGAVSVGTLAKVASEVERRALTVMSEYATHTEDVAKAMHTKNIAAQAFLGHALDPRTMRQLSKAAQSCLQLGPKTPMGQQQLSVDVPSLNERLNEDQLNSDMPLSRDELKEKAKLHVKRSRARNVLVQSETALLAAAGSGGDSPGPSPASPARRVRASASAPGLGSPGR